MAKEIPIWVWFVGAAVIYFVVMGGSMDFFSGSDDTDNGDVDVSECNIEDVSFTPKMTRTGKAGTTLSDQYYILTDNLGAQSASSATTVPVNYDMEVLFGENSTKYYSRAETVKIACADPTYYAVDLAYADTDVDPYAENTNGQVNSVSYNQSMGASDVVDMTVCIKAGADTYFGNPNSDCKNIAVAEFDRTYINQVEGDTPAAVPGSHTFSSTTFDGRAAFVIPKVGDGSKECFNIQITATATEPTDAAGDINLTLFDCDIDKDEDTLELIEDVNDEDNNLISLASQSLLIRLD